MKKSIFAIIILSLCYGVSSAQKPATYQLSTHILDTNMGRPASGVKVHLYKYDASQNEWIHLYEEVTDSNGRIEELMPAANNNTGHYKFRFETLQYFNKQGMKSIYPYVEISFSISDTGHYHIPLVMTANGYSTYRGN